MNNVFIIVGVSRSGKTTLARDVAERIKYNIVDMDDLILKEWSGQGSIRDCYYDLGDKLFRKLEVNVYENFIPKNNSIVAVGGGALLNNICVKCVASWGLCGWLFVPKNIVYSRWKKSLPASVVNNCWDEFYYKRAAACAEVADFIWSSNLDLFIIQINNMLLNIGKNYGK